MFGNQSVVLESKSVIVSSSISNPSEFASPEDVTEALFLMTVYAKSDCDGIDVKQAYQVPELLPEVSVSGSSMLTPFVEIAENVCVELSAKVSVEAAADDELSTVKEANVLLALKVIPHKVE